MLFTNENMPSCLCAFSLSFLKGGNCNIYWSISRAPRQWEWVMEASAFVASKKIQACIQTSSWFPCLTIFVCSHMQRRLSKFQAVWRWTSFHLHIFLHILCSSLKARVLVLKDGLLGQVQTWFNYFPIEREFMKVGDISILYSHFKMVLSVILSNTLTEQNFKHDVVGH